MHDSREVTKMLVKLDFNRRFWQNDKFTLSFLYSVAPWWNDLKTHPSCLQPDQSQPVWSHPLHPAGDPLAASG